MVKADETLGGLRIGIFGAGGFLGRGLTRLLGEALGENLVLISRSHLGPFFDKAAPQAVRRTIDMRSPDAAEACKDLDVLVDLVCDSTPRSLRDAGIGDIFEHSLVNCRFYEGLARAGRCHVVFISSGGTVYGESRVAAIPEDHPTLPISSYGLQKLATELGLDNVSRRSAGAITYTVLRLANPYGPGQQLNRGHGLIPAIFASLETGRPISLFGDGSQTRDYVHIRDVVTAVRKTIARRETLHREVINIGGGKGYSIKDVCAIAEKGMGATLKKEFVAPTGVDVARNVLDIGKAKRLLDWQPTVPFEEGLTKWAQERAKAEPVMRTDMTLKREAFDDEKSFAEAQALLRKIRDNGQALWFFLHIPKTAGSSFRAELAGLLKRQANITIDQQTQGLPFEERRMHAARAFADRLATERLRFASGHLRWPQVKLIADAKGADIRLVTMLRHPVDRLVSAYRYMRTPVHPPYQDFIAEFPSLEAYVESPASQNHITHFLSDGDESADTVLQRLLNDFAFVGLQEDYNFAVDVIFRMIGGHRVEQIYTRKTEERPENRVVMTPELRARIEALNARDMEVYLRYRDVYMAHRGALVGLLRSSREA